jgi:hypothetical protein
MRVFAFEPGDYRDQYASQGWVHVPNGIDPDFFEVLRAFAEHSAASHHVEGTAIAGTKQQALFEFPADVDFPGHLFDVVATAAGLQRPTMTLSERHIKAYDADTPPDPPAHKDRLSSQCSVGLTIVSPADSRLLLWPDASRARNNFNVSAALRASLPPEELPEVALRDIRPVEIDDQAGDVVLFPGSSVWHARRNGARAVNLYLKFNDFDSDPLGEDPRTPVRRAETVEALNDGPVAVRIPVLSRRLDTVTRVYTRDRWGELVQASVWDQPPVALSDGELLLLRKADGVRPLRVLAGELAAEGLDGGAVEACARRLAERGVLDLRAAPLR